MEVHDGVDEDVEVGAPLLVGKVHDVAELLPRRQEVFLQLEVQFLKSRVVAVELCELLLEGVIVKRDLGVLHVDVGPVNLVEENAYAYLALDEFLLDLVLRLLELVDLLVALTDPRQHARYLLPSQVGLGIRVRESAGLLDLRVWLEAFEFVEYVPFGRLDGGVLGEGLELVVAVLEVVQVVQTAHRREVVEDRGLIGVPRDARPVEAHERRTVQLRLVLLHLLLQHRYLLHQPLLVLASSLHLLLHRRLHLMQLHFQSPRLLLFFRVLPTHFRQLLPQHPLVLH